MSVRAIGEITGLWTLVVGGLADVQMSWVAAALAAVWSVILIGGWLGFWERPRK